MAYGTNTTVDCPLCGTSFDPSDSGGWCTNSDCGDWQYEGDDAAVRDDERGSRSDSTTADGSGGTTAEPGLSCPACGTGIESADNFCRACGIDVSHIEPGSTELTACPSCETDVEAEDSFCRNCGEALDVYRPGEPEEGDAAGQDGSTVASDSSPNSETPATETSSTSGSDGADDSTDGPRLSLVVRNREIQVGDGDTVGRKIRSIIMDTGGDEEDAVRVHREHVRLEHEDDQFHLVDLGRNPTIVNGDRLQEGDRVPISPGDRIELSGIATIQVQRA